MNVGIKFGILCLNALWALLYEIPRQYGDPLPTPRLGVAADRSGPLVGGSLVGGSGEECVVTSLVPPGTAAALSSAGQITL